MFGKLKQRFQRWAQEVQRREIARLHQETRQLKGQIERETGRPIQLTPEERNRLAEIAQEMDLETLEEISIFDRKEFMTADIEKD